MQQAEHVGEQCLCFQSRWLSLVSPFLVHITIVEGPTAAVLVAREDIWEGWALCKSGKYGLANGAEECESGWCTALAC